MNAVKAMKLNSTNLLYMEGIFFPKNQKFTSSKEEFHVRSWLNLLDRVFDDVDHDSEVRKCLIALKSLKFWIEPDFFFYIANLQNFQYTISQAG